MKKFLVGGAVRDKLLGLPPRDYDYLIVDSSFEEMKNAGFIQVGKSYDVFIHPLTREEHVLGVDLEADLERRDLTINAMAIDESGNLIDLFGGQRDLKNKILRHTSRHFSDDPLRVYRLARFKAQYPNFSISPETIQLSRTIAKSESFKNLQGERIFGELKDALVSQSPATFFSTLKDLQAFTLIFDKVKKWPELDRLNVSIDPRLGFAFLLQDLSPADLNDKCRRLMVPNEWSEAAFVANRIYHYLSKLEHLSSEEMVGLLYHIDAFRRPELLGFIKKLYGTRVDHLIKSYELISQIGIEHVSKEHSGKEIGEEIKRLRIKTLSGQ